MTIHRIAEFLKGLKELGISLIVLDGDLDIKSPKGKMTPEILSELKERKAEIIEYLSGVSSERIEIRPIYSEDGKYPVSSAQRRLWVLSQFEEASIGYNMPNRIHLYGYQSIENLEKAINAVINRHEILRTVYKVDGDGQIHQVVQPSETFNFSLEFHDYRSDPAQVEDFIDQDAYRPFDLENGPLLRAALLQMKDEEYVFYYNMHHIISDGWSGEVLSKDMFAYYNAYKVGVEVTHPSQIGLRELKIQYKDFATWQMNQLVSGKYQQHQAYWLNKLAGDLSALNLPTYRQRPKVKTYNGENLSILFHSARAKQFVEKNGGSQFMVVLSVLNTLIYRYTGTKDVIVGTPIVGREHTDLDDQIGLYVNTLVLRNEVDPKESFDQLYRRVKADTLEAYEHQMYPFDKLVEELELKRDPSRSVVFDISITYHNIYREALDPKEAERIVGEIRTMGSNKVKNDIELHVQEFSDYFSLDLFYNKDIYDGETMGNFMRHFKQMMECLMEEPDQPIERINFLTKEEQKEQLFQFNDNTTIYNDSDSLVGLFQNRVGEAPNNTAIVSGGTMLTYAQLDEISTKLANCLKKDYGVSKGNIIGVQLDKSEWAIITLIGILKVGGVYLPIDADYPSERKKFICQDSGLDLLITETQHIYGIDYYEGGVFAIDVEFAPEDYVAELDPETISGDDLAYIIYTSGSSGKPKGVLIENKAIANTIRAQIDVFGTDAESNGLLFASLSFDASISEIFTILLAGGTLSIMSELIRKDPQKLVDFIRENKVTIATLPPSYLSQIEVDEISGLNKLITAGESANTRKAISFLNYGTYFNAYGPTETAICATIFKMENETDIQSGSIPIGKPINNVDVYVLNECGLLQAKGVAGEICIGGVGLAKGYLNNEKLTNEKFIQSPFEPDQRIYKTGDLGRWLPNGDLDFIGRIDEQLKINGYRIEPGEIEHAILENENVRAAVVVPKLLDDGTTSMTAYIVPEADTKRDGDSESEESLKEVNLNDIRSFLENRLPAYMIPSEFIQLGSLVLTTNGKIDKNALSKITGKQLSSGVDFIAAQSENEKVLVDVLKKILLRDSIGIFDSFYNLGGDSIKSIQVVGRLKKKGYFLTVENILKFPEVKTLAGLMTKAVHEIDQSEVSGDLELSPIQHWFFNHKGIQQHHHFNQSVLLKSEHPIDLKIIEECLDQLTTHHDALRLIVEKSDDGWKLFNQASDIKSYSLYSHDLTHDRNSDQTILSVGQELQASFDLAQGPLFKVVHFKLNDYCLLGLIAHHIVVDGVSWRILLEDLRSLYIEFSNGNEAKLPQKTSSFMSWTAALKVHAKTEEMQMEQEYWKQIGAKQVERLPAQSNEGLRTRETSMLTFNLGKERSELLLTKVHHVYKTEINDVLLTALGLSLKSTFGIRRITILMEGHGREDLFDQIDLSRTVGWFTSVYPFLLDLSESTGLIDALVEVKDARRKIPKNGIGFGILSHLSEEKLSIDLEPQITFNYLGDFGGSLGGDETSLFQYAEQNIGKQLADDNTIQSLLDVSGIILDGNLNLSLSYPSGSFEDSVIHNLLKEYETNLVAIIETLSSTSETFLTASDFTFSRLSSKEMKSLIAGNNVVDVYELSPLQKGMYFHWLSQESKSMYFEQTSYRVSAPNLDLDKLKNAYIRLIDRHAVLRTSFSNDYADRPLQIVHKNAPIQFSYIKLGDDANIEAEIERCKEADLNQGFDLEIPSQMRLVIIQLTNNQFEFIWSHHHILMDGWCVSVLINDFNALLKHDKEPALSGLPEVTKYSNYIKWLGNIDQKNSLDFWKNYLSDYDQVISFPFENGLTVKQPKQVAEKIQVKGQLYREIEQLCIRLEITTSTFVQGVWGFLLSIYNNSNDVVFGKVVSGRPGELEGVEEMIGLFINTVPIRVKYNETDTPIDLLKSLQNDSIESTTHHYINLSEVQAQSAIGMDLINHIMIYQNYAVKNDTGQGAQSADDIALESMYEVVEQSNYDLNVVVGTAADSLYINLLFNDNRFDRESMKRLTGHLDVLIKSFVEQSDQQLSGIGCLSEEEKNYLSVELNQTQTVVPDLTILDLVQVHVSKSPNAPAVTYEDKSLTYAELDQISNQFAHYLINEHDLQASDFVEVKLPRTQWISVAILGIWKAGGVHVPVDPEYPSNRIDFIEKDANCKVVVDEIELNTFITNCDNYSNQQLESKIDKDSLAYVLYTSGSTGRPKGALITHGSLNDYFHNYDRKYPMTDVVIQPFVTSISFDMSLFHTFYPLTTGGQCIVVGKETFQNLEVFVEVLKRSTVFDTVPAMFTSIVDYVLSNEELQNIPSVKRLYMGGDRIPNQLLEKLQTVFNNAEIVVTYGPTETTLCATGYFYERPTQENEEPNGAIIGTPNDNCAIYIVNEKNSLQPKGVIGEICIGGAGVGRGYLNREDLTSEKFIESPFVKGDRIYKSGDLGRWTKDDKIEFIGRMDDQVKIRGFRIELGEIEFNISQIDQVEQVVVIALNHPLRAEKELVAYYTVRDNSEVTGSSSLSSTELRALLKEKLPDYMVPSYFIHLASLPLTPNGKIDRKNLPRPDGSATGRDVEYLAPETEIQKKLVKIWEEILEQKKIGINDDFFALGGHSLKALRLIMSIKKEFDIKLEIKQLFQNPTIFILADELERIQWISKGAEEDESNLDIIEL